MKSKSLSHVKYNIAWASIISIFIGCILYVPILEFSNKEPEVVYRKVPIPVYINLEPAEITENQTQNNSENQSKPKLLTKNLKLGDSDPEVKTLQQYLNTNGFLIADFGPGSPGNETNLFGAGTRNALIKYQEANSDLILKPFGLSNGTGILGEVTRNLINS